MLNTNNTNNNRQSDHSEKLSQYTLLGSNHSNSLRKQSFMSEPPVGLGIENFNLNSEDLQFNRRLNNNSFNSSTHNNGQHTTDTFYNQTSTFPYSGSENTKRRSISQSPRSNISFDNKRHITDPSKKLDEISNRVASLENTVNQLVHLVAQKNDINLPNQNINNNKHYYEKNIIHNPDTLEEQDVASDEDNEVVHTGQSEEGNGDDNMSAITTTVKNPVTQEPKLFKLDPKKIVKKRNKSKSTSRASSFTKLNKIPYLDQEIPNSNIPTNNNKVSISHMLEQTPYNFNSITGSSFFSNLPLLETNGRKRNSSLGLPLPLSATGNSMFPNMNQQQSMMFMQGGKKSQPLLQSTSIPNASNPTQQIIVDKDTRKPSIMMPTMNGSLALPAFSPRGTLNGSIDSLSSARTSFDEKQLQIYQQLQKISQQQQQQQQQQNQIQQNQQTQMNPPTHGRMESILINPSYQLDSNLSSESSTSSSNVINNNKKQGNDRSSKEKKKKMVTDIEKTHSDSEEHVHVLSQTPDISQLLNDTGRLKTQTVSKTNPKVKPRFQYSINRAPSNIAQVWKEYRYGIDDKPPLMELDQKFGNYWLESKSRKTYSRRKVIYEYILRGIQEGLSEDLLISQLENLRYYTTPGGKDSKKGVGWVQDRLINIHTALGYAKLDNLIRTGALKHIIHNETQMKSLLDNASFNNIV